MQGRLRLLGDSGKVEVGDPVVECMLLPDIAKCSGVSRPES